MIIKQKLNCDDNHLWEYHTKTSRLAREIEKVTQNLYNSLNILLLSFLQLLFANQTITALL